MTHVELMNRAYLESEFDRRGVLKVAENFIEDMKEQIRNLVVNVGEELVITAKVFINRVEYTILSKFLVIENEDGIEDGQEDGEEQLMTVVEFRSLDVLKGR